jgi:hypothetical protein
VTIAVRGGDNLPGRGDNPPGRGQTNDDSQNGDKTRTRCSGAPSDCPLWQRTRARCGGAPCNRTSARHEADGDEPLFKESQTRHSVAPSDLLLARGGHQPSKFRLEERWYHSTVHRRRRTRARFGGARKTHASAAHTRRPPPSGARERRTLRRRIHGDRHRAAHVKACTTRIDTNKAQCGFATKRAYTPRPFPTRAEKTKMSERESKTNVSYKTQRRRTSNHQHRRRIRDR